MRGGEGGRGEVRLGGNLAVSGKLQKAGQPFNLREEQARAARGGVSSTQPPLSERAERKGVFDSHDGEGYWRGGGEGGIVLQTLCMQQQRQLSLEPLHCFHSFTHLLVLGEGEAA